MDKFIHKNTVDFTFKKHHTSNLYARNVLEDWSPSDDKNNLSKADEVKDFIKEERHRDEELSGMSLREINNHWKKYYQKSRRHSRALGFSDRNIGMLKDANQNYVNKINLIQPAGSEKPLPLYLDEEGLPTDQTYNDITRVLDVLSTLDGLNRDRRARGRAPGGIMGDILKFI